MVNLPNSLSIEKVSTGCWLWRLTFKIFSHFTAIHKLINYFPLRLKKIFTLHIFYDSQLNLPIFTSNGWIFFAILWLTVNPINPLTPKIWLLILPSGCYTFPYKLITRIWCSIKVISCTWWVWVFSLPVCWIMYGYYKENLHVNHFWELKG